MPAVVSHLIETLPRTDRARLLSMCEPVELGLAEVLAANGAPQQHIYFPTGSIVSVTTPPEDSPLLEVGMVAAEGMLGMQFAFGFKTALLRACVQDAGSAWRVAVTPFKEEFLRSASLQESLNRYLLVSVLQLASFARCLRFHRSISDWHGGC